MQDLKGGFMQISFPLIVAGSFLTCPFSVASLSGSPELFCPSTLRANETGASPLISGHQAMHSGSLHRGKKASHQANSNKTRS